MRTFLTLIGWEIVRPWIKRSGAFLLRWYWRKTRR
ncbi:hypothetical protein J2Y69_002259 [Microbacterium resistens]|uniref:Uncharacterized protein n=1 Tax=Microbacterium resistens TaxID=156977 RepID=A0ABU1SDH1_9MICO|nr:hypothetical protein [Microbacterium resistens]